MTVARSMGSQFIRRRFRRFPRDRRRRPPRRGSNQGNRCPFGRMLMDYLMVLVSQHFEFVLPSL